MVHTGRVERRAHRERLRVSWLGKAFPPSRPTWRSFPLVAPPFPALPTPSGAEGPSLYNFSPSCPASLIGCSVSSSLPQMKLLPPLLPTPCI